MLLVGSEGGVQSFHKVSPDEYSENHWFMKESVHRIVKRLGEEIGVPKRVQMTASKIFGSFLRESKIKRGTRCIMRRLPCS